MQDTNKTSKETCHEYYLRNRKQVPCCYRVIETRVEVWRTRNAVGTRAAGECFHSFFEFSQTSTRQRFFGTPILIFPFPVDSENIFFFRVFLLF